MMPEDRKKLYQLIERWTRAEVAYRIGPLGVAEFMEQHADHMNYEDQIRDLMFGSHDLVELGIKWGIVDPLPKEQKPSAKSTPNKIRGQKHESQNKRRGPSKSNRKPLLERS